MERDTPVKKPRIIIPNEEALAQRQRAHDLIAGRQYANTLRFVRKDNTLRLVLKSGAIVNLPVAAISELAKATPSQLAKLHLLPTGAAIEQRELDIDLSVPGLLRDALGFGEIQQRRAARTKTPAKAAASRANGAKGGRPIKKKRELVLA